MPVIPIATPIFARLQGRRVVHAVAGHGHDLAARLEGIDDLRLVRRGDAAADVYLVGDGGEFLVAHLVEFASRQDDTAGRPEADLRCYGLCRIPIVAGDHDALQAGSGGDLHRFHHLGPRRVDHAEQPDEGQIRFDIIGGAGAGDIVQGAVRNPQHPEGAAGHVMVLCEDLLALGLRQVDGLTVLQHTTAEVQNDVGGPFDEGDTGGIREARGGVLILGLFVPVDRGHPLAVRIEANLLHPREGLLHLRAPEASLCRGDDHGAFCGIAMDMPDASSRVRHLLLENRIIAEHSALQENRHIRILPGI